MYGRELLFPILVKEFKVIVHQPMKPFKKKLNYFFFQCNKAAKNIVLIIRHEL